MFFAEPNEAAKGFSGLASRYVKPENYRGSLFPASDADKLTNLFYGFTEGRKGIYGGLDDEALLGTIFWQLYTQTKSFQEVIGTAISPKSEFIVSNNGDGQYVLLVLDPLFDGTAPAVHEVIVRDKDDIAVSIYTWIRNYLRNRTVGKPVVTVFDRYRFLHPEELSRDLNRFVFQVTQHQKFQIIHTRMPTVEPVQCLRSSNCLGVRRVDEQDHTSTAGVIAENSQGQKGVTIAFHALRDPETATTVFVEGSECRIVSKDPISDSCFVVPEDDEIFRNALPTNGPLIGKTPRGYQAAEYTGVKSGRRKTIIDSWSKDLPFVRPYNQLKVFTKDKASPGDSGSALLDDENNVAVFAFFISGFDAPVDFTAWIWAESVFQAHNLKP